MLKNVKTSVIGSYPVDINCMALVKDYFNGKAISWEKYIEQAVSDMLNAGIDIISDGQTRDPFINIFTRYLKGCRIRNRSEIIDKVGYKKPITIKDQDYVRSLISNKNDLIGVIVGPHTLSESVVNYYYKDKKELAFDFACTLNQEAKALQKNVDMISIDEPFYSNCIPEYGKELMDIVTKNISCQTRLHVCGDVSNSIPKILDMPVDILSHEFKASPQLFDSFSEYNCKKMICLGSVRSDSVKIETVEEIITHIKKGLSIFGDKICQISPDCGQRLIPRNIAFQKLKNLVIAGEKING
jgi:5-methyltetrahydropteroyltriglutamate--homocysteine methyltransferase